MKYFVFGLLIIMMFSCTKRAQEITDFELIDVSISNGWTDFYFLKLFNNGKAYILNDNVRKGETYFLINITKEELDSISSMVKVILSTQIDTIYKRSCIDCSYSNLIIKSKDKVFKTLVYGNNDSNKKIECVNDLIGYLYTIAEIARDKIDSNFVYESRTKYFYPVPPASIDQQVKFVPPSVIDTIQ
jgi:hypothetical protein